MSKVGVAGLLVVLFHTSITPASAQDREIVTQGIEWFSAATTVNISSRVSLLAEGQFRFVQHLKPMQFQARTGIDIVINKHISVMPVGYVYTWNPLYGKQPNHFVNNEHRLFEQVVFKHTAGKVKFNHRLRLEQRYIQVHTQVDNEIIDHGYDLYVNRLRYRLQAVFPLKAEPEGTPRFSAVVYNEIFVSFGDAVIYHEPDQNRIFAGLGYHIDRNLQLQAGPLYQALIKAGGTKQENNFGVLVSLLHNLHLSKD